MQQGQPIAPLTYPFWQVRDLEGALHSLGLLEHHAHAARRSVGARISDTKQVISTHLCPWWRVTVQVNIWALTFTVRTS